MHNLTLKAAFAAFVVPFALPGCVGLQQVGQSAANNAKPASAPVMTERPSFSAAWKDTPATFYVGARTFSLNVTSDLFNTVSVKLGGRQADELPRGSFTDYRPVDWSQLAGGHVYFRLLSQSSDPNRQTELDMVEILDKANAFVDAVPVVSTIPLIVGETSVNPAYKGTPDAYKEGSWNVVLDRKEIGPAGSGGLSACTFDLSNTTDPFAAADVGFYAPPGKRLLFQVPSNHCKAIGFWYKGQPTEMVEYPDTKARVDNHGFTVPSDAALGSTINFQVVGYDLLKRRSFYDVKIVVRQAPAPPPLPCSANNGLNGHTGLFSLCATCGSDRFNYNGQFCTEAEAQTGANNALSLAGQTGCSLTDGVCAACQTGQPQPFPFCSACPGGQFAWFITDGAQPACTREDATKIVEGNYATCSVTPSLSQTFDICVQCPGQLQQHVPVQACTDSQAVEMQKASSAAGCTVAKCP